jgi:acyl-CoA synthetase (AMP-forming)/AMP-acid ligase II
VALFLHTSGTTSKPKGVPLTHANIAASLANIAATYELTSHDVSYMVMPLFHVHGLMAGTFAPLAAGGAVVLPVAGRFSASVFWRDCVEHGATFYTAVPTMHQVGVGTLYRFMF